MNSFLSSIGYRVKGLTTTHSHTGTTSTSTLLEFSVRVLEARRSEDEAKTRRSSSSSLKLKLKYLWDLTTRDAGRCVGPVALAIDCVAPGWGLVSCLIQKFID